MKIETLINRIMEEKMRLGHGMPQAYRNYWELYFPIIRFCRERGQTDYTPEILNEFITHTDQRYQNDEIKRIRHSELTCAARKIIHYAETGTYLWSVPKRGSRYVLNAYYQDVMDEFLQTDDVVPNTKQNDEWVIRRYFHWLERQGIEQVSDTNAACIQRFFCACFSEMKSTSVYNVRLSMKKLYAFLFKKGYASDSYEAFFSFKICRESKMYPAAEAETVNAVLNVIDTQTVVGKRDRAMILLGYVLGIRSVDIAHLRLRDVLWERGELQFMQQKTRKTIILPLTADVGEALKDYILNARPKCEYEEIFLRSKPPYFPFKDPCCIGNRYDIYMRKAGIERKAHDGKGFHSLRRAAGKNLVTNGIPVNVVAQVLGDSSINSTKKYISLDSEHLVECALDFHGIETGVVS